MAKEAQREERAGQTLSTRDHDEIRRWAEEHDCRPAAVEGTEGGDTAGVLRLDCGEKTGRLREVSWDEWFRTFDERDLEFIYQEHKADGSPSTFFKLVNAGGKD
jgi:hypothetical protein